MQGNDQRHSTPNWKTQTWVLQQITNHARWDNVPASIGDKNVSRRASGSLAGQLRNSGQTQSSSLQLVLVIMTDRAVVVFLRAACESF